MITKEVTIEELVSDYPQSVRFLMEKGIKCLACGEPVWGTLESSAKDKGFDDTQVNEIVQELNTILSKEK
jgi:methionine synthase II (cobalamin-independent)